jgi:hypothetical protein
VLAQDAERNRGNEGDREQDHLPRRHARRCDADPDQRQHQIVGRDRTGGAASDQPTVPGRLEQQGGQSRAGDQHAAKGDPARR